MSRLLLVDDDPAGLEVRRLIFERGGHSVLAAKSPDEARLMFSQIPPDVIVLDLRLPEASDGLALIREFRERAPQVRIVVLSGWTPDLDGQPEAEMVDEVLAKPVRTARLVQAVSA